MFMRQMTFINYLKYYLSDVSGQKTVSIHKLYNLSKNNIRIISPLILYCVFSDKQNIFFKYFNVEEFPLIEQLNRDNFLDSKFAEYDFQKIHQSYLRKINVTKYDDEIKLLVRNNILKLMKEKGITNYKVYKVLGLNPGNVNDYLSNGNPKKVSLATAKLIFEYCSNTTSKKSKS